MVRTKADALRFDEDLPDLVKRVVPTRMRIGYRQFLKDCKSGCNLSPQPCWWYNGLAPLSLAELTKTHTALCEPPTSNGKEMTKREQLVYDFIKAYVRIHGIPPSYEVIAKGLNLRARSNIHRIVHNLKDYGLIETRPHKFHAIRIVDKSAKEMAAM